MTAAMVAGVVSPVAAAGKSFPDVPAGHWAEDSINYLVDKGAIVGKPDGTYGPAESIDRASAAVIFTKILNLPVDENAQPSFKDAKIHGLLNISQQLKKLVSLKVTAKKTSIQKERLTVLHLLLC